MRIAVQQAPITVKGSDDIQLVGSGFEAFGDCYIRFGGDVPHPGLVMLHPHDAGEAREVRKRDTHSTLTHACA